MILNSSYLCFLDVVTDFLLDFAADLVPLLIFMRSRTSFFVGRLVAVSSCGWVVIRGIVSLSVFLSFGQIYNFGLIS